MSLDPRRSFVVAGVSSGSPSPTPFLSTSSPPAVQVLTGAHDLLSIATHAEAREEEEKRHTGEEDMGGESGELVGSGDSAVRMAPMHQVMARAGGTSTRTDRTGHTHGDTLGHTPLTHTGAMYDDHPAFSDDDTSSLRDRFESAHVAQQSLLRRIDNLRDGIRAADDMYKKHIQQEQRSEEQQAHRVSDGASTAGESASVTSATDTNGVTRESISSSTNIQTNEKGTAQVDSDVTSPSRPVQSSPSSRDSGVLSSVHRLAAATRHARETAERPLSPIPVARYLRARPPNAKKPKYRDDEESQSESESEEEDATATTTSDSSESDQSNEEDDQSDFEPDDGPYRSKNTQSSSKSSSRRPTPSAKSKAAPREAVSRTSVNPDIDQHPAYIHYVIVNYQYIVSREEAARMSQQDKSREMVMPIRWLVTKRRHRHAGRDQPPTMHDLFVVAKDIATLIHKRRGSIAKAIAPFHPLLEKGRVRVYGCRSPGKPGTQLLTVLSMRGVDRLMRKSKFKRALEVLRWTNAMANHLCTVIAQQESAPRGEHINPDAADPIDRLIWHKRKVARQYDLEPEDVDVVTLERFKTRFTEEPELVLPAMSRIEEEEEEEEDDDDDEDQVVNYDQDNELDSGANRMNEPVSEDEQSAPIEPELSSTGKRNRKNKTVRSYGASSSPSASPPVSSSSLGSAGPRSTGGKVRPPSRQEQLAAAANAPSVKSKSSKGVADHRRRAQADVAAVAGVDDDESTSASAVDAKKALALQRRRERRRAKKIEDAAAKLREGIPSKPSHKRANAMEEEHTTSPKRIRLEAPPPPAALDVAIPEHSSISFHDVIPSVNSVLLPINTSRSVDSTPSSTPRLTPMTLSTPSSNYTTPPFSGGANQSLTINSFLQSREATPISSRVCSPVLGGHSLFPRHLRMSSNTEMVDLNQLMGSPDSFLVGGQPQMKQTHHAAMVNSFIAQQQHQQQHQQHQQVNMPLQQSSVSMQHFGSMTAPRYSPGTSNGPQRFQFSTQPHMSPSGLSSGSMVPFSSSLSPSHYSSNMYFSPTNMKMAGAGGAGGQQVFFPPTHAVPTATSPRGNNYNTNANMNPYPSSHARNSSIGSVAATHNMTPAIAYNPAIAPKGTFLSTHPTDPIYSSEQ